MKMLARPGIRLMSVVLLTLIFAAGCKEEVVEIIPDIFFNRETKIERLKPADLAQWPLIGKGTAKIDEENDALILVEGSDSKGITLVSPKSYGNRIKLSFDVKPLSYEGVSFVFLSASDVVTMGQLKVPDDHSGNIGFWTEGRVQNYVFAFHDGFYDSKPFIKKNPGLKNIAIAKDLVKAKNSFSVEVGRKGRQLWIAIDGEVVVRGKDKSRGGLPDGRIGFRLRGPGKGSYGCVLRNVTITEEI